MQGIGRPRAPYVDEATELVRQKRRERTAAERARKMPIFRAIIAEFLNNPCVDCGRIYPRPAMHPDHVGPKKYKIAWFSGGNGSVEALKTELSKCVVRCANCHYIRHAKEW